MKKHIGNKKLSKPRNIKESRISARIGTDRSQIKKEGKKPRKISR